MVSSSSREHSADSTSTLPYSYGQAVFTTSSPISSTTTTSLSNPPSYSDSLSYTLTSSSPSSLSLSHPIYRPLPTYALPRTTNSLMESIPCLYSSVFSTNTLSMSHHGGFSTMVSSVSSRPIPSGSRRKVTRSWPRNWLRSWPRDNTFYTTRRQCPRPASPCSSLSSNTVLFHSNSSHPHIYSPMVTFNEPSENVRGMFSFVHSCQFSPGANNKLLFSSLIRR